MSKIPWTGITWNPVSGCSPISRGCQNCYAKKMAYRLKGRAGYPIRNPFKVTFHPDKLYSLDKKPCMVFVVSMGDLFHPDVKDDWILGILNLITSDDYKNHTFQILTKRPERAYQFFDTYGIELYDHRNIWFGTSVEEECTAGRITDLCSLPVAIRFISCEPLLSKLPMYLYNKTDFEWVIAGAEKVSGRPKRKAEKDWFRNIRDWCIDQKVPFFLKQMQIGNKIVEMPKLDGKVWNQYPNIKESLCKS